MKIDVCSDLHVDSHLHAGAPLHRVNGTVPGKPAFDYMDWANIRSPDSQVLVIAGDISNEIDDSVHVIRSAANHYGWVVATDGNHEHYDHKRNLITDNVIEIRKALMDVPNVIFLDGEFLCQAQMEDVLFVGGLGWYDWLCYVDQGISEQRALEAWFGNSNDVLYPYFGNDLDPAKLATAHSQRMTRAVTYAQCDENIRKVVMVTHTSPRADLMAWIPSMPRWNELTPSYVNSQMRSVEQADVKGKISHWIYGHTHDRKMVEREGRIYVNNARGRPREAERWFMVQIDV